MPLFRWVLIATLTSLTTAAPAQTPEPRATQVAVQHESEPRVEIGEAVLTVYDESGRAVVVQ
jgi:hypothetical protein